MIILTRSSENFLQSKKIFANYKLECTNIEVAKISYLHDAPNLEEIFSKNLILTSTHALFWFLQLPNKRKDISIITNSNACFTKLTEHGFINVNYIAKRANLFAQDLMQFTDLLYLRGEEVKFNFKNILPREKLSELIVYKNEKNINSKLDFSYFSNCNQIDLLLLSYNQAKFFWEIFAEKIKNKEIFLKNDLSLAIYFFENDSMLLSERNIYNLRDKFNIDFAFFMMEMNIEFIAKFIQNYRIDAYEQD